MIVLKALRGGVVGRVLHATCGCIVGGWAIAAEKHHRTVSLRAEVRSR